MALQKFQKRAENVIDRVGKGINRAYNYTDKSTKLVVKTRRLSYRKNDYDKTGNYTGG
ncbi:hypothetical protein bcgnr5383_24210 [Bacillus cereus]